MAEKKGKLSELIPDDKNLNKHTQYGMSLLEKSVRGHKFGRSILVDKNNRIIAGNGIVETAANIGAEDIRIIETTGDELVVVKRTDVDLDTKEGREMALADNATSAADLEWDDDNLQEISEEFEVDVSDWGLELEFDKRKGWSKGGEEHTVDPKIDLKIIKRGEYSIIAMRTIGEEGIPLSVFKQIDNASKEAKEVAKYLKSLLQDLGGWCITCPPSRRHADCNFSKAVSKKIGEILNIPVYEDIFLIKTRQRINNPPELIGQINEKNVIIYDDILTTGSTIRGVAGLLKGKSLLLIVGVNNN